MSTESLSKDEIFNAAAELSDSTERQAYLNEACADDPQMRSEIEDLLELDREAGSFLESPPPGLSPTLDQPITVEPGTQIGPYKLLQQIGEGGMGVVYMAEQKEPVKRRVALKIIKPGMDTRQVIARFEAERQALAMMDHPNIAKVLDAGATEGGRPYFVMELVNGISITQYCDEQHLTPKERLELFVPICKAVQHAHQKGIIHRDLKPSNLLVALYDGQAVPKIIDFGVAKATSQTLTEKTMFTQLGQVVGTLEYMSPEQAERNQLDIDTRSDIYSLGVVLYELLTGETPFNSERLRSAAFQEMLRIIREEEPSKPSTKVSSSQSLPSIAANRRIEAAKLGRLIRGELDWIVLKAMDKDRGRRYETASKFAEDLQHYLNDEAVTACPPSTAYRMQKFVARHRGGITVVAALFALLLGGISASTVFAIRAKRAEYKSRIERDKARAAEGIARDQLVRANEEADSAEFALKLVANALEDRHVNADGPLRGTVERLSRFLDESAIASPEIEANARLFIGRVLHQQGSDVEARTHLEKAYHLLGPEGDRELRRDILQSLVHSNDGDAALEYLEQLFPLLADSPGQRARNLGVYAQRLRRKGKLEEALATAKTAVAELVKVYGTESIHTAWGRSRLGNCLLALEQTELALNELDEAKRIFEESDDLKGRTCIYSDIGRAHQDLGDLSLAAEFYNRSIELGIDRRDGRKWAANSAVRLGYIYSVCQNHEMAAAKFKDALEVRRQTHGGKSPETLDVELNLALELLKAGASDEALRHFMKLRDALRMAIRSERHIWFASLDRLQLVHVEWGLKRCGASPVELEGLLNLVEEAQSLEKNRDKPYWVARFAFARGAAYGSWLEADRASEYYRAAIDKAHDSWMYHPLIESLSQLEQNRENLEEATGVLEQGIEYCSNDTGMHPARASFLRIDLAEVLVARRNHADAEGLLLNEMAVLDSPLVHWKTKMRFCRLLQKIYIAGNDEDAAAEWRTKAAGYDESNAYESKPKFTAKK